MKPVDYDNQITKIDLRSSQQPMIVSVTNNRILINCLLDTIDDVSRINRKIISKGESRDSVNDKGTNSDTGSWRITENE